MKLIKWIMKILYHPKRILGFETYVAPDDFDRKAQPVDIYDVFERYYKNHRTAKWIYTVEDSWTYPTNIYGGTSYRYGYKSGGVNYTNDILFNGYTTLSSTVSGTVTSITVASTASFPDSGVVCLIDGFLNTQKEYFTYTSKDSTHFYGSSQTFTKTHGQGVYYSIDWGTSTNRWVITNNTSISPMMCYAPYFTGAMEWLYIGKGVKGLVVGSAGGNTCRLKYIHINKLSDITDYGGISSTYSHYGASGGGAWGIAGRLTGTLHISGSATTIPLATFIGQSLITKVIINEGVQTIYNNAFKSCTSLNGTLTIPNTCTEIGASAFNNCNKLDTLNLGTGVITIGNSAFQSCAQLSGTLVLPDSLTTIGTLAFYGCTSFSGTLTIPANVTSIGQGAFGDDNFTDIDVTANSRYEDVDDVLYEISTRTALHSVKGNTGTITFQTNTLIIGDYCCLRNQRTGTLTVPDSVTRVGIYAFYDCDGFTAISLEASSSSLATIDDYAFSHCSNLAGTLTLPNSVTLVDAGAFRDDVLITGIVFSSALVTIGADAFRQMTAISENLVIPNSVETIGANAFYNNTARTGTLTLGTGLKTIGGLAFYNTQLTGTLSIPSLVTAIGEGAFHTNNFSAVSSAATGFTVSDYVLYDETTSGQIKAHTSVRGYTGTLTLKAGTTSILSFCFYDNDSRSGAIVIPYTVTAIGQQAFQGCAGFNAAVVIGDGTNGSALTTIGYLAFYDVDNVTRYDFYRTPAPLCNTSGSFGASPAKELHITSGATGYDVTPATAAAPWTNTAIFSSVTADL